MILLTTFVPNAGALPVMRYRADAGTAASVFGNKLASLAVQTQTGAPEGHHALTLGETVVGELRITAEAATIHVHRVKYDQAPR